MHYFELLGKVEARQLQFFESRGDTPYVYHNLPHTQKVVAAAAEIANHYQLSERDFFVVVTAAWFHDAGYYSDCENHEAKGAEMAADFLREMNLPDEDIQAVKKCILATRMPQSPTNLLEQIVCDADLYHLGTDQFPDNNKLLRREMELRKGQPISGTEWRRNTIRLLESHHYFTDYARLLLADQKNAHLEKLKAKEAAKSKKETAVPVAAAPAETGGKKRPDRGIETMFRSRAARAARGLAPGRGVLALDGGRPRRCADRVRCADHRTRGESAARLADAAARSRPPHRTRSVPGQ